MCLEKASKVSHALWEAGLDESQGRRAMDVTQIMTAVSILAFMLFQSCGYVSNRSAEPSTAEPSNAPEIKSAGLTGQAGAKDRQIQTLEDKIDRLEDKITRLERQVADQKRIVYTVEYTDPAQLYQKARTLLLAKEYNNAADLFTTFTQKHPDHSLADNAVYWLGECKYTMGQYKAAANVFRSLIQTYPKAEKVPDAMLKAGYAYLSLDDYNRASHYLKQVIKKFPFSPAAVKAQAKLNAFQ